MSILLMVAVDGPVELRMSRLGDLGGKCGLGSTFSTAPLQGFVDSSGFLQSMKCGKQNRRTEIISMTNTEEQQTSRIPISSYLSSSGL